MIHIKSNILYALLLWITKIKLHKKLYYDDDFIGMVYLFCQTSCIEQHELFVILRYVSISTNRLFL